ncbi:MAG: LOG family protein [Micromonosporaceae bacterium]
MTTLRLHAKPCVVLDPEGFYTGLLDWLRGLVAPGFVRADAMELLQVVDTVPAAFDALEAGLQ